MIQILIYQLTWQKESGGTSALANQSLLFQRESESVAFPPVHLIPPKPFHCTIGWLLERVARASLSPEARDFTEVQAGLEVHAGAKLSTATVMFRYVCVGKPLKYQAAELCSHAVRIGV